MNKFLLSCILGLILSTPAFSQPQPPVAPFVKVDDSLTVKPGRLLKITCTTNGKMVKWINLNDNVDLIQFPDGLSAIFCCDQAGVYKIGLYTALADIPSDPVYCTITVYSPTPPIPPTPPLTDPLSLAIYKAYGLETDVNKLSLVQDLAAVQRLVADKISTDTTLKTNADALVLLKNVIANHHTLPG